LDGETLTVYEYRASPGAPPILVVPYGKLFFSVGTPTIGADMAHGEDVSVGAVSSSSPAEPTAQQQKPQLDLDTLLKEHAATMVTCHEALKKQVKASIQQERALTMERLDKLESLLLESINTTFSFAQQQHQLQQSRHAPTPSSTTPSASSPVQRTKTTLSRQISTVFRTSPAPGDDWEMTPEQLNLYQSVFESADADNVGSLDGTKVAEILSKSELPKPVLAKIWALAALNHANRLNVAEFCIAMHLTMKCRSGSQLPDTLPSALKPSQF